MLPYNHHSFVGYCRYALFFLGLISVAFAQLPLNQYQPLSQQQIEVLNEFAQEEDSIFHARRQQTIFQAQQQGLPLVEEDEHGNTLYLDRFEQGEPIYLQDFNLISARASHTDHVKVGGSTGFNLTGIGQILGIWESTNMDVSHPEFDFRAFQMDVPWIIGGHPTHVAGTMIGNGTNPAAEGMAPYAFLLSYNSINGLAEKALASIMGVKVGNHSFGAACGWSNSTTVPKWNGPVTAYEDWKFGAYSLNAKKWDDFSFVSPFFLIVAAAGNHRGDTYVGTAKHRSNLAEGGYDTMAPSSTSKNCLTVGAISAPSTTSSASASILVDPTYGPSMTSEVYSNWGPTDDGRIKPDIMAHGTGVFSADTAASGYSTKQGTSMASPVVAGTIGLLHEHWTRLNGMIPPLSHTMKGLVIHTADDLDAPGPDYRTGWGLLNGKRAAEVMERDAKSGCQAIYEKVLPITGSYSVTVNTTGLRPLKATLVWTDPGYHTYNTFVVDPLVPRLVNDLDLRITEGTSTHLPWKLSPGSPADPATRGNNMLDNVEQVLVEDPGQKSYTITVSHSGVLKHGFQAFALIITGHGPEAKVYNFDYEEWAGEMNYHAADTITAGGTAQVKPGAQVGFYAADVIQLSPDFEAHYGAGFEAKIKADPCASTTTRTASTMAEPPAPTETVASIAIQESTLSCFPNPVSDQMTINLNLAEASPNSQLRVVNQFGQTVALISDGAIDQGMHQFAWDSHKMAAGMYHVIFQMEGKVMTRKVVKK